MELTRLMREAGIVGAGGAGFPSYAKISEGADTLLINGSECEPLLYTDYIILETALSEVLRGIECVLDGTGIPVSYLCIKNHTAKRLMLEDGIRLSERVFVKCLPDVYPIGDEISLIYEATGRVVRAGNLPISARVIVYNVETMYNLARALLGEPVTDKWLTVGGRVERSVVMRVPIGTRVSELFSYLKITLGEDDVVLDGGPSMGKPINPRTAVVTKTTKGIMVLPRGIGATDTKFMNEKMAVVRAETACCQCTRCTDMCPRALLGYPLEPHKMVRTAMGAAVALPKMVLAATLCCGCGICESIACSQGISPRAVINNYKELLRQNKMRYVAKDATVPKGEREYRMVPSERWASTLGVKKYDRVAEFISGTFSPSSVEIPLSRHIGIPSTPSVKTGERVKRGELIASAAEGLSVPQHASRDGVVTVADGKIIIA